MYHRKLPAPSPSLALVVVGLAFGGSSALAADKPLLPPLPAHEPAAEGFAVGWYLRGDLGYSLPRETKVETLDPAAIPFDSSKLGKAPSFTVGAGAKVNGWLRADITATLSTNHSLTATWSDPVTTATDTAKLRYGAMLANAYLDLGTWSGLTPYVGAGIGVGSLTLSGAKRDTYALPGHPAYPVDGTGAPALLASTSFPNKTITRLAWAAMAGMAVDVSEQVKIDVGYRYLSLGRAETGTALGSGTKAKDIAVNEFHFGLRYLFAPQR